MSETLYIDDVFFSCDGVEVEYDEIRLLNHLRFNDEDYYQYFVDNDMPFNWEEIDEYMDREWQGNIMVGTPHGEKLLAIPNDIWISVKFAIIGRLESIYESYHPEKESDDEDFKAEEVSIKED